MVHENLMILSDKEPIQISAELVSDGVRLQMISHVCESVERSTLNRHVLILGKGKAREIMEALKKALEDEENEAIELNL